MVKDMGYGLVNVLGHGSGLGYGQGLGNGLEHGLG